MLDPRHRIITTTTATEVSSQSVCQFKVDDKVNLETEENKDSQDTVTKGTAQVVILGKNAVQPPEEVKAKVEHDLELDENKQIDAGIKANQLGDDCSEPQTIINNSLIEPEEARK